MSLNMVQDKNVSDQFYYLSLVTRRSIITSAEDDSFLAAVVGLLVCPFAK